jgi:feruloyl esterase
MLIRMARTTTFLGQVSVALYGAASLTFAQSPCDKLKSLALPDTILTAVENVATGPYLAPGGRGPAVPAPSAAAAGRGAPAAPGRGAAPAQILPAHCRVAATLKPSADSDIKMEIWMPADNWNGKFQMVGNGG